MPYKPLSFCLAPACPQMVSGGYCKRHRRELEWQRGSASQRGYDYQWSMFSKRWLERHPICGERADGKLYPEFSRCVQQGLSVAATCTDHIVSMRNGGAKYDETNLGSLCTSCNSRKRNLIDGVNRGKGLKP